MYASQDARGISFDEYDAWLFDLGGVVVADTASVHAAWKEMFDGALASRSPLSPTAPTGPSGSALATRCAR